MALQVGALCFADAVSAGAAACSATMPTTQVVGTNLVSSSCSGVDSLGALLIKTTAYPLDGTAASVPVVIAVTPAFGDCLTPALVDAGLAIMLALLVAWVPIYAVWKIIQWLGFTRGAIQ